jgi:prepilin-type N-terminal cleavage/methylation domain-containing protein
MIRKNDRGFTLIELLVVIVIIGILAAMALPNFVKAREKAKEAEVKSNIHSIQVALERYAVDTGGVYPLILYGGDWSDSFTTSKTPNYLDAGGNEIVGISEYDGDVDILLEFGYLSQYPRNPFQRVRDVQKYGRLIVEPADYNLYPHPYRVNIWSDHPNPTHGAADRASQLIDRQVGGEKGDLMWDLSEGQRHIPFPIVVVPEPDPDAPDNYYQYTNPTMGAGNIGAATNYRDDHLFFLQPGNFYYYATFSTIGGYSSFLDTNGDGEPDYDKPVIGEVTGFNLAGYGTISNPAKDVYNIFGDYPARSLFTINNPNVTLQGLEDLDKIYVGPDGRSDGVIIVVQSGADQKTPESKPFEEGAG